jgi:hypothetical protein
MARRIEDDMAILVKAQGVRQLCEQETQEVNRRGVRFPRGTVQRDITRIIRHRKGHAWTVEFKTMTRSRMPANTIAADTAAKLL